MNGHRLSGMRIGVDIDDVIYPWFDTAHSLCERAGITNGVSPTTWRPFDQYGCTEQEWWEALEQPTRTGDLYYAMPIAGTMFALRRMREAGHTVHLVTARGAREYGDLIRRHTIGWLAAWAVPFDTLHFTTIKSMVRVDVFADDSIDNVTELEGAGIPTCLISAAHNADAIHVWRRDNLGEFADDIVRGVRP